MQKESIIQSANKSFNKRIKRYTPFIGLLLLCIVLTILSPYFLTTDNLLAIGAQMAVIVIMAVGETVVIITSGIDLSVGSVLALSGIITSVLLTRGVNGPVSIAAGVMVGALCGFINGFLISKGKLPPFIATLGMMGVARGVALVISDGGVIFGFPQSFNWWGMGHIFGKLPVPVFLMIIVSIIGYLILRFTKFGRCSYAIGSNSEATMLAGIHVEKYLIGYYTLCGLLAGFAGIIMASRLTTGQPTAATGYELDVIAACVIGGASLSGGIGTMTGVIIGGLIMGILRNGCNLLDISTFWQQVLNGIVIVSAVFWDQYRKRQENRKKG